jgi:hypothetical protein
VFNSDVATLLGISNNVGTLLGTSSLGTSSNVDALGSSNVDALGSSNDIPNADVPCPPCFNVQNVHVLQTTIAASVHGPSRQTVHIPTTRIVVTNGDPCSFPLIGKTLVVQEEPTTDTMTTTPETRKRENDPRPPCLIPTAMSRPGHGLKDVDNIEPITDIYKVFFNR